MAKVKGNVLKDPILKRIVEIIVKELDPDKIILFGSRARGDYNEYSDYDILVLKRGIKPEDRGKLTSKLYIALGVIKIPIEIDVIVQDLDRFKELSEKWYLIYYDAQREGITIYEKGKGLVNIRT